MANSDTPTELSYLEKKKNLQEKNKQLQTDINSEIEGIKSNVVHYGKYALIIGGTFVATYYLASLLFPSSEDKAEKKKIIYIPAEGDEQKIVHQQPESSYYSPIVRMIMGAIATFLLSIAKEKLIKLLEDMSKNEAKDTQPAA